MITLEQFRASGRDVPDLDAEHPGLDLEGRAGRVYQGGGYVEKTESGWYLCLGRSEYEAPLDRLEELLFDWCKAERFFDEPVYRPVERQWFIGHKTNPTGYTATGPRRWVCPSNDHVDLFSDAEKAAYQGPLPRGGEWVEFTS